METVHLKVTLRAWPEEWPGTFSPVYWIVPKGQAEQVAFDIISKGFRQDQYFVPAACVLGVELLDA